MSLGVRSFVATVGIGLSALAGCKGEPKAEAPSREELAATLHQVAEDAKARVDAKYAPAQNASAPGVVFTMSDTAPAGLISLAAFYHDDLDECADVVVEPVENGGSKETRAMAERFVAYYKASRADFVQVPKLCSEQFEGRAVLASCLVHRTEAGAKMTAGFRYYKSYTLQHHDAHMRDCLKLGGTWKVASEARDATATAARN